MSADSHPSQAAKTPGAAFSEANAQEKGGTARRVCDKGHPWDISDATTFCPTCGPATAAIAPARFPPEFANHSRYRLVEFLGAGGMGAVYKAEHLLLKRTVAIKVISPHLTTSGLLAKQFEYELRASGRLFHRNIVLAFDADRIVDLHFLVMEYVEGASFAQVVTDQGPMSVLKACNYVHRLAVALNYSHRMGHVHGDIKPQNLMLTSNEDVKILDFGLARMATVRLTEQFPPSEIPAPLLSGNSSTVISSTAGGMLVGTPDYMAPEQAIKPLNGDTRSDIYSLGCTFYYLLTGQVPFPGGSLLDKLRAHQSLAPKPVSAYRSDVPSNVVAILDRMMAKNPEDRYRTAGEVASALAGSTTSKSLQRPSTPLFANVLFEDRGLRRLLDKVADLFRR